MLPLHTIPLQLPTWPGKTVQGTCTHSSISPQALPCYGNFTPLTLIGSPGPSRPGKVHPLFCGWPPLPRTGPGESARKVSLTISWLAFPGPSRSGMMCFSNKDCLPRLCQTGKMCSSLPLVVFPELESPSGTRLRNLWLSTSTGLNTGPGDPGWVRCTILLQGWPLQFWTGLTMPGNPGQGRCTSLLCC